jgi:guanine deaminase
MLEKIKCNRLVLGHIWNLQGNGSSHPVFNEIPQGAIAINNEGKILAVGEARKIQKSFYAKHTDTFKNGFLVPGFIDTHIHFPQMSQIGSYGESLLGWLEKYIFPEEESMAKPKKAKHFAPLFFEELIRNGTTTSLVLSNSDLKTTEILFKQAEAMGVRSFIGKVSMDRLAPKALLRKAKQDESESEELISKWHGKHSRLFYALTPRFSLSCTKEMLTLLGELAEKHPTVRIQTHFSENLEEIALVKKAFPKSQDYLQTYEDYGLINDRTVLAHCLHASPSELRRIGKKGAHLSHCPTSNLFLGSGLFPLNAILETSINVSMGTDVGAGTSFSIWNTLAAAYQVQRLGHSNVTPAELLYFATLGGAKALGLESEIGNFEVGKDADIQVLDWSYNPILKARIESSGEPSQRFFACLFHFDPRLIQSVYIKGRKYRKNR